MQFDDNAHSIYNGKRLKVEIFGASHAKEIGVKVDGFENQSFSIDELQKFLDRRKPKNKAYSTKRLESDKIIIKSGVCGDKIIGQLNAVIENTEQKSNDYQNLVKVPRPSHADFVAYQKYGDKFDYRGGGKFSGRLTAPMCIAGGVAKQILLKNGVEICAYISQIGEVKGKSYKDLKGIISLPKLDQEFPLLDNSVKEQMQAQIENARQNLDSVGGVIECVVQNLPVGTGEYMFDSLESVISHLAFAVPAVKGIEFGSGFDLAKMNGSMANDSFYFDNGTVKTKTNHNGGINGGISNGMPLVFRVAIKPTPSIAKEQDSVDLEKKQNVKLKIEGRHDACITPRAVAVIEAITALAIYDSL